MARNKVYVPKPGSIPAKVVEYFTANPEEELTALDIQTKFGVEAKDVSVTLNAAVANGALARLQQENGKFLYALGTGEAVQAAAEQLDLLDEEAEPEASFGLWSDGELCIQNVALTDNGCVLSAKATAALREYLLHTGSFIEHLAARADAGVA